MPLPLKVPYHCSFLMDKDSGLVKLSVAWRRVGASDFGVYVTGEERPQVVAFKADYSQRGEIQSFWVVDHPIKAGEQWEENHIDFEAKPQVASMNDAETIRSLLNTLVDDWLEPFGESEAARILKKMGLQEGESVNGWAGLAMANLPMQIKRARRTDILSCAEVTSKDLLYAFVPFPDRVDGRGNKLLESKMKMFLELI